MILRAQHAKNGSVIDVSGDEKAHCGLCPRKHLERQRLVDALTSHEINAADVISRASQIETAHCIPFVDVRQESPSPTNTILS